jgi:ribosomal protein S18 acetylase RimI-like enzyme
MLIIGPTPATTGTWDLYWIAAHPELQGTGVAQALDAFAGEYVRARGGYLLIAETSGQPGYARARAFYQKQGYAELARIPDYYKPADDLVVFGRRL